MNRCYIQLIHSTFLQLAQLNTLSPIDFRDVSTRIIWSIWCYRDSINCCELHEHATLLLINQLSKLIVSNGVHPKISKHIILVYSYRSRILAVSINLRSNCYSVMVNIINNIDVDILFLLIQTSDVQFIECVQLYLRQCHHLPIQYRNILALLWAARLIWCWRLWIIWFNNQLTCSLDVYIASVVLWQVLFQALDELLHLLNW